MNNEKPVLEVDVLFVGAGPAGLAGSLHLMNLVKAHNHKVAEIGGTPLDEPMVAVIEKGAEVGAHAISGAVLDPRAMMELFPEFETETADLEKAPITDDSIYFLTGDRAIKAPLVPPPLQNHGCFVVSLQKLTAWLGRKVEAAGVNVFPGFPGAELIISEGRVEGVVTREMGLDKSGNRKSTWQPGTEIRARVTVLCEGARGSLTKVLVDTRKLENINPQVYSVGVKEVWEVPGSAEHAGRVIHTMGYPLSAETFGGGFIYHLPNNRVAVGLVTGLDYRDPFTDPHHRFSMFKSHPLVSEVLRGGKLEAYGAKTIPEGGLYSMPVAAVDGCLLAGDGAGTLNPQRLKGIHTAMKSGMLAARTIFDCLLHGDFSPDALGRYRAMLKDSWINQELFRVRNFHQAFEGGLWSAMIHAGLQFFTGGRGLKDPWKIPAGHTRMRKVEEYYGKSALAAEPPPPVFDGKLTFNKADDVYFSGTVHEEDQPCHLKVADLDICHGRCREEYSNPCRHFCPAGVYEMVEVEPGQPPRLQINFSNCVHCKTCDIMDPYAIITWVPPEGGGGPVYVNL